jgi:toxin ParE1/3/4
MPGFVLSPEAESDLESIWNYVFRESGSPSVAYAFVERIAERFWTLASHPYLGRRRDEDLSPGLRSHVAENHVIFYRIDTDDAVSIVRVLHGSRDMPRFFR